MKKIALLVGVEKYQDRSISKLEYAAADVKAVAERLRNRCGFDEVRVLADAEGPDAPVLGNVLDALRDMAGEVRPGDTFLFFFSGHGIEVADGSFLLTADSRPAFPEQLSLSVDLLRQNLAHIRAGQVILLLDACRNDPQAGKGDADNPMGDVMAKDIATAIRSQTPDTQVTALLSACRPGQRAYEWHSKGHGVFTHFLLEGLDKAAWESDRLSFRRLAGFTSGEVRRWSASTPGVHLAQEPWYEEFGTGQEIILGERKSDPKVEEARRAEETRRREAEAQRKAEKQRESERRRREEEERRRQEEAEEKQAQQRREEEQRSAQERQAKAKKQREASERKKKEKARRRQEREKQRQAEADRALVRAETEMMELKELFDQQFAAGAVPEAAETVDQMLGIDPSHHLIDDALADIQRDQEEQEAAAARPGGFGRFLRKVFVVGLVAAAGWWIWNRFSSEDLFAFDGHGAPVETVAFGSGNAVAYSGGDDGTIRAWNLAAGVELWRLRGHEGAVKRIWINQHNNSSLSQNELLSRGDDGFRYWDMMSKREVGLRYKPKDSAKSLTDEDYLKDTTVAVIAPDGTVLGAHIDSSLMVLTDLESGRVRYRLPLNSSWSLHAVQFASNGRHLLAVEGGRGVFYRDEVYVWDVERLRLIRHISEPQTVYSAAISPDGRRVLTGSRIGQGKKTEYVVRLWAVDSGREIHRFEDDDYTTATVAFSPDGRLGLSAGGKKGSFDDDGDDCEIRIWDLEAGKKIDELRGHRQPVNSAVFSPDGKRVLSGSEDGTVRLWELRR